VDLFVDMKVDPAEMIGRVRLYWKPLGDSTLSVLTPQNFVDFYSDMNAPDLWMVGFDLDGRPFGWQKGDVLYWHYNRLDSEDETFQRRDPGSIEFID